MRFLFCVSAALAVCACSTSSGVIPFGKDTFTLAVSAEGGVATAKQEALVEANQYCSDKGMVMMPVSDNSTERFEPGFASDTLGTYDLVFRCLSESDPDYLRTTPDRPDVVIENR